MRGGSSKIPLELMTVIPNIDGVCGCAKEVIRKQNNKPCPDKTAASSLFAKGVWLLFLNYTCVLTQRFPE